MTTIHHNFTKPDAGPRHAYLADPQTVEVAFDFGSSNDPRRVGTLEWDKGRRCAILEWDETFVADPLPLSPMLVRQISAVLKPRKGWFFEGIPAPFADSLPDGWARQVADAEILARGGNLRLISGLGRLAQIGQNGLGALTYQPAWRGAVPEDMNLEWFSGCVASLDDGASIEELLQLRLAAGGAHGDQPKFLAQMSTDGTRLRSHRNRLTRGWRHVLIKRREKSARNGSIEAEVAYALMAQAAGIQMMPVTTLQSNSKERFLAVERFDVTRDQRFHMQTAAALFGMDHKNATVDYIDLLKLTRCLTRDSAQVEQMLLRMIFNARAVNRNDHLRNHSFLMDAEGRWYLSPAYDLTHTMGKGGLHRMTMAGNNRQPGPVNFVDVGRALDIKPARVLAMRDKVDRAISQWDGFAEAACVPRILRHAIKDDIERALTWH